MFEIIIQFLIGVLTPIIFIGGIIAVLNELIQSFEKKEEYNRKLEELEEEIKEFSSQNQTLVEDCKSKNRQIKICNYFIRARTRIQTERRNYISH